MRKRFSLIVRPNLTSFLMIGPGHVLLVILWLGKDALYYSNVDRISLCKDETKDYFPNIFVECFAFEIGFSSLAPQANFLYPSQAFFII